MLYNYRLIGFIVMLLAMFLYGLTACSLPDDAVPVSDLSDSESEGGQEDEIHIDKIELKEYQIMQKGNKQGYVLVVKPLSDLADNRIGNVDFMREDDYIYNPGFIEYYAESGMKWVRLGIDHACFPDFDLAARQHSTRLEDRHISTIKGFADAGINVICCLIFWDIEAGGQHMDTPNYSRFRDEGEVERYLEFVRETVRSLKGTVAYYEILNEPNPPRDLYVGQNDDTYLDNYLRFGNQHFVRVTDYVSLVEQVVPVIREQDPEAMIAVGAVCEMQPAGQPPGIYHPYVSSGQDYLFALLDSRVMPLVDGVTFHPLYNITPQNEEIQQYAIEVNYDPPAPEAVQAYYDEYPDLLKEMSDIAAASGFTGVFIADEISYWSPAFLRNVEIHHPAPNLVFPEIQAAKYHLRSIMLHLGMDMVAIATAENHPVVIRNLSTIMSGHEAVEVPVKFEINYDGPLAHCSFRYPEGGRMLAVWTDDVAVDEDTGVPAKVTFPGIVAEKVIGIDVLHGLEQELVFDVIGESTVVSDILVKDYPIMIHLVNPEMSDEFEEITGPGFHRLKR